MKKFVLLFCLICFILVSCNENIDTSLTEILELSDSDKGRALNLVDTLEFQINNLTDLQKNKLIVYSTLVRDKNSQDVSNDTLIFDAITYFKNRNDNFHLGLAYMYAGRVLDAQGNGNETYEYFLKAKNVIKKIKCRNLEGVLYYFMGNHCAVEKSYDKALQSYREALILLDSSTDTITIYNIYNNMGLCYAFKNNLKESIENYNKSIVLANQMDNSDLKFNSYIDLGVVYQFFEKPDSSKVNFLLALEHSTTNIDSCRSYIYLADMLFEFKNNKLAAEYVDLALSKLDTDQIADKHLEAELLLLQSRNAEMNKDYKEALNQYKAYSDVKLEAYDKNISDKLSELEKKYEFSELQNEKNRYIIRTRNYQLVALFFVIVTLVLFVYLRKSVKKGKEKLEESRMKSDEIQALAYKIEKQKDREIELESKIGEFQATAFSSQTKERDEQNETIEIMTKYFDILTKAALLKERVRDDAKLTGSKFIKEVNEIVYGKNSFNWEDFIATKNQLDNNCFDKIERLQPTLTESEYKTCCLAYCKLDNMAIAMIMGLSENTIKMRKQQIRKKLGIQGKYSNFFDELNKLVNEQIF